MPRVALDGRFRSGGVGRYSLALVRGLKRLDGAWEVSLLEPGGFSRKPFTAWGRRAVGRWANVVEADLIHGLHLEIPSTDVPCVVSIPDLIPLDHEASMSGLMRRSVYEGIIDRSIEHAQRILTLSSISRDSLVERGADPLKIRIVPPAVDMRFTPLTLEEIKGARERFAEGRSYVAAAMRDKPHKNYPGLLAAAKALSHMDVKFVMTGMPARDREVAGVGPLNDRELRAFYGGAEAVAVPSYIEGFGLPVGEALACGVPVVCGNRVGALDLLAEGTIAVDPSDHGEFAEAVVSLIRDPHRRKQLVDGGRPKALALTEHALAEATASVYSEVVG